MRTAAGLALLLVGACGGQHASTIGTSTTPVPGTVAGTTVAGPPSPSMRATVRSSTGATVVSDDASGSAVHLHAGQQLEVHLTQATYDPPVSSDSKTLFRRSSSGGYPTTQPVMAVFEATGRGAADITTTTDAACFHTQPRCLMPTRQWVVHVTVT